MDSVTSIRDMNKLIADGCIYVKRKCIKMYIIVYKCVLMCIDVFNAYKCIYMYINVYTCI